jgi:hypothetical protein
MASAVRKLTGVGGDIRKIARLLQKEAPPGHMLAYINQEEADLLKARGGSGEPHADTGVPSFEDGTQVFDYDQPTGYQGPDYSPGAAEPFDKQAYNRASESAISGGESGADIAPVREASYAAAAPQISGYGQYRPTTAEGVPDVSAAQSLGTVPDVAAPSYGLASPAFTAARVGDYSLGGAPADSRYAPGVAKIPTTTGTEKPDDGFFSGMSDKTKARLGIGGAQSLIGAYQISQATEQAKKYREDLAKLAQPYQTEGKKLIAQAQSGELTPAAQQQLQAAQAQAAQGAEKRGGVGAQQAMMAVENMRQQLLQNQYDYGLKVSGIGDQIASGAIKAGMQADQYVNSLAGSYANNIARTLSNAPTYVTSYSQQNQ